MIDHTTCPPSPRGVNISYIYNISFAISHYAYVLRTRPVHHCLAVDGICDSGVQPRMLQTDEPL